MARAGAGTGCELSCPACAAERNGHAPPVRTSSRNRCPHCGEPLGNGTAGGSSPSRAATATHQRSAPVGVMMLVWRNWMLRILERAYWLGTFAGSAIMLVCGGFVPVGRRWLRNEISGWADIVATLGGVWFPVVTQDPDSDLGPVVARVDAPQLFGTIDTVGRRLGVKPPGQVRLTYLPCCGVVAWRGSQALLIGLPLFRVLTQGELRAIVAHELRTWPAATRRVPPGRLALSRGSSGGSSTTARRSGGRWVPGHGSVCARHRGSSSPCRVARKHELTAVLRQSPAGARHHRRW